MVERSNGRISELVAQTRFSQGNVALPLSLIPAGDGRLRPALGRSSAAELETTLKLYLSTYNHSIPQRALHHQTPIQALKAWREKKPDLFVKRVYEQAGLDRLTSKQCPAGSKTKSSSRLTASSASLPARCPVIGSAG